MSMPEFDPQPTDEAMVDDYDCWNCGGSGWFEDDCTCGEDCCFCLEKDPPRCRECNRDGHKELW